MIPSNNTNIRKKYKCYYSNHCEYSKELVNEIFKFKVENKIELVCVDKVNIKHNLPKYITEVPTIWNDRYEGTSKFKLWKWLPYYLKWYFYLILRKPFFIRIKSPIYNSIKPVGN